MLPGVELDMNEITYRKETLSLRERTKIVSGKTTEVLDAGVSKSTTWLIRDHKTSQTILHSTSKS